MTHPILATPRSGYGGRGYRIPGRDRVYPSVTTVLNMVNKPGLYQWVADMVAAKAVVSLSYLQTIQEDVGWSSLRFVWSKEPELVGSEVRQYWEGVRNDAAELGTNIHEWIEADIDGLSPFPEPTGIEAEEMTEAWIEWFDQHEVISHRQEFTCVNDELGYAGTADADWTITCLHDPDEKGLYCLGAEPGPYRTLVDLKSARNTWPDHDYQLAGLANCPVIMRQCLPETEGAQKAMKTERGKKIVSWWVEDARPTWDRYALLHIRPDDLDTKGNRIGRFARLIDRTEDMDIAFDGFVGAFMLSKSQYTQKARNKERGLATEETE